MQDVKLLGEESHTEISVTHAALCFKWSRPLWPDETRLREASQKLTFVDFLEALGRFADLFSPLPRVSAPLLLCVFGKLAMVDFLSISEV